MVMWLVVDFGLGCLNSNQNLAKLQLCFDVIEISDSTADATQASQAAG